MREKLGKAQGLYDELETAAKEAQAATAAARAPLTKAKTRIGAARRNLKAAQEAQVACGIARGKC